MKKIRIISLTLMLLLMINIISYAVIDNTIHFDVSYNGTIKVNTVKDTIIILAGNETPLHAKVRVKIDIKGPSTPKLMATDSLGNEIDIAQWGYWGPEEGFAIQGTFSNETPVKATFTEAGAYTITLSLLDVANGNDVLAQKAITIQVQGDEIVNEPVEELPKTGTSLIEYTIYAVVLVGIIYLAYQIKQRKK